MRQVIKGDGSDGTAAAKAYLLAHDSLMTQELYEITPAKIQIPGSSGIGGVGGLTPPIVEHLTSTEDFLPTSAGSDLLNPDGGGSPYGGAPLPWGSITFAANTGQITRTTARTLWGYDQPGYLYWNYAGGAWYGAPGSDNVGARPRSAIAGILASIDYQAISGTVDGGNLNVSLDGGTTWRSVAGTLTYDGAFHTITADLTSAIAALPGGIANFDFTQIKFKATISSSLFVGPGPATVINFANVGLAITYSSPSAPPGAGSPILPYLCDASSDLTYAGNLYKSTVIKNDGFKSKIGLDVDSLKLSWTLRGDEALIVDPDTGATILTILQGFQYGILEGYWVKWRRAIMPTFGDCDSIGAASMFRGKIAEVELDRLTATITVNSITDLFNRQIPQQLIEANNRSNQVGPGLPPDLDPDPAHWTTMQCVAGHGGSLTRIVAQQTAPTSGIVYAPGTFDMGYLWFQFSPFENLIAQVRHYEVVGGYNVFDLFRPLYADPHAYAASFVAFIPVPKDQDVSGSSLVELKGFPWVPLPEQSI
jgi:hypothetical protein